MPSPSPVCSPWWPSAQPSPADIEVLARDHLHDLFLGVEIPLSMRPLAGAVEAVQAHDTWDHRRVGFAVELSIRRRLDMMFDPRRDHRAVAGIKALVA